MRTLVARRILFATWLLAACGAPDVEDLAVWDDPVRVETDDTVGTDWEAVRIRWGFPPLIEGETRYLAAEAVDRLGRATSEVAIEWSSTSPEVAEISVAGTLRATGEGTTEIVARFGELEDRLPVKVTSGKPARIDLTATEATMDWFGSTTIHARVYNSAGIELALPIEWLSADEEVATAQKGTISGVYRGSTTVWAVAGEAAAAVDVTIVEPPPMFVDLEAPTSSLLVGEETTFTARVLARDERELFDSPVTFLSSAPSVLWIDPDTGRAKAMGAGFAEVQATAGVALDRFSFEVGPAPASSD